MPSHYTQITLAQRPVGAIDDSTFKTQSVPFDFKGKVGPKQVLVKVTYVALEPAMRGWLNDSRSYVPPVKIGEVMRAAGLGVIIEAGSGSQFKVGHNVTCYSGWTEFIVLDDSKVTLLDIPRGAEPLDFLNTLGSSGMTAYFGLKDVLDVKKGETLVVSGAAGSVGVIVCQLAKKIGAKVYAIAGSPDKCSWLEKEIGVDRAFNYKSSTFKADFKEIGYVHAFFDNVGGEILDLVLSRLQKGARIALCGAISAYSTVVQEVVISPTHSRNRHQVSRRPEELPRSHLTASIHHRIHRVRLRRPVPNCTRRNRQRTRRWHY
jgi:NADPH-dependent curcumin reductase CurA